MHRACVWRSRMQATRHVRIIQNVFPVLIVAGTVGVATVKTYTHLVKFFAGWDLPSTQGRLGIKGLPSRHFTAELACVTEDNIMVPKGLQLLLLQAVHWRNRCYGRDSTEKHCKMLDILQSRKYFCIYNWIICSLRLRIGLSLDLDLATVASKLFTADKFSLKLKKNAIRVQCLFKQWYKLFQYKTTTACKNCLRLAPDNELHPPDPLWFLKSNLFYASRKFHNFRFNWR